MEMVCGSPWQTSLKCLAPRKPKCLLSLLAKLAPTKEPYWPVCSEDFTFGDISTFCIKNQTTTNTENGKGWQQLEGSVFPFSYCFLPTYKAAVPAGSTSDHLKGHLRSHQCLLLSGTIYSVWRTDFYVHQGNCKGIWLLFQRTEQLFSFSVIFPPLRDPVQRWYILNQNLGKHLRNETLKKFFKPFSRSQIWVLLKITFLCCHCR